MCLLLGLACRDFGGPGGLVGPSVGWVLEVTPEGLGAVTWACWKHIAALTWLRIQTWVPTLPALPLGDLWEIPRSSPDC